MKSFKTIFSALAVGLFVGVSAPVHASLPVNLGSLIGTAVSGGIQMSQLTDNKIAEYSRASVAQLDAQNKVAPAESEYTKRLNRLTRGLTSVGNKPLNFKVYLTSDVNAFACPDGSVRVYSGLMDIMTDEELLGIMGHEIGHVAKKHSLKQARQELVNKILLSAVGSTGGIPAALSNSQLGQLGQQFVGAKYSQKQEKEADDYGYKFLKDAGLNPWGMITSLEKIQKMEGGASASYFQKMFSSHPETAERIKRLEKQAAKDKIARPTN
ncbi:MAG: M48 family metallopeptidase [Muribaculaceae bacterium]|nr:M48 family metallopeptidase [Muribaculaceae bacterium]